MKNKKINRIIVGISGKKRSGKDTLSDILINKFKENSLTAQKLSFANPIKRICEILLDYPEGSFNKDSIKNVEFSFLDGELFTGRELMQKIGTDCIRKNLNETVWVSNMEKRIRNSKSNVIIISDLRFKNELKFIKNIGGVTIRIFQNSIDETNIDNHSSECELDDEVFDHYISNKKSVFYKLSLKRKANSIVKKIIDTYYG